MQIDQKYGNYLTGFTFNENKLDYMFSQSGNKVGGSVAYEKIPKHFRYRKNYKYWMIKYIGVIFILVGVLLAKFGLIHGAANSAEILLMFIGVGSFLFFMSWMGGSPMLSIYSAEPAITVIHDAQRQTIMDEIDKRRTESKRKKFMEVDFLNSPVQEYEKFRYLRSENIITEREFNDAVGRIIASQQHKPTSYVS